LEAPNFPGIIFIHSDFFYDFFGLRNSDFFEKKNKIPKKVIFSRNKMRQMQVQIRLENIFSRHIGKHQYIPHNNKNQFSDIRRTP